MPKLKRHDPNTNLTCYDCGQRQSLASFTGLKGHVKRRKYFPMPKGYKKVGSNISFTTYLWDSNLDTLIKHIVKKKEYYEVVHLIVVPLQYVINQSP